MLERRRLPRWLKRTLLVAATLFALYFLRLAVGLGIAASHFSTTPDFESYIASTPVDAAALAVVLEPFGEPEDSSAFIAGAVDPLGLKPEEGPHLQLSRTLEIEIEHGDEGLLHVCQQYTLAVDRETGALHGIHIASPLLVTCDGMRMAAVIQLPPPEQLMAEETRTAWIEVDALLAAGEGEPVVYFTEMGDGRATDLAERIGTTAKLPHVKPAREPISWWRCLFGVTSPIADLPEEGLVHVVNATILLQWDEGGAAGSTFAMPEHVMSTEEYSYQLIVRQADRVEGNDGTSHELRRSRVYTWNGEVW